MGSLPAVVCAAEGIDPAISKHTANSVPNLVIAEQNRTACLAKRPVTQPILGKEALRRNRPSIPLDSGGRFSRAKSILYSSEAGEIGPIFRSEVFMLSACVRRFTLPIFLVAFLPWSGGRLVRPDVGVPDSTIGQAQASPQTAPAAVASGQQTAANAATATFRATTHLVTVDVVAL